MILWNDSPLSLQRSVEGKPFTQNNGQLWNGESVHFTNLPILSMKGTSDISTSRSNTLYLPSKTVVWRITFDDSHSNFAWIFAAKGNFLNGYSRVYIHKKLFEAGSYIIDNKNALYLFKPSELNTTFEHKETGL